MNKSKSLNTLLFGSSVAMSWVWGLGLFFSVQFAFQFGVRGLLSFAIPNALGLFLFGYGVDRLSKKHNSLENFFFKWSAPYTGVVYFYQLLALLLTFFAIARYFLLPIIPKEGLFIFPLSVMLLVIVAVFLGEEFSIKKIKYSHFFMFLMVLVAVSVLLVTINSRVANAVTFFNGHDTSGMYWGYILPILSGFLVGPWLDIQQWQRAIQMKKEHTSITKSYGIGAVLFFTIIVFHGVLLLFLSQNTAALSLVSVGIDGNYYAHALITRFLEHKQLLIITYAVFIVFCTMSTLDSGYIALKWYLKKTIGQSKNVLLTLVPEQLVISPFIHLFLASIIALVGVYFEFELIYFVVFYGSFFVIYSLQAIARAYKLTDKLPDVRVLAVALGSVIISAFGYFLNMPQLLSLGALVAILPALHVGKAGIVATKKENDEVENKSIVSKQVIPLDASHPVNTKLASEAVEGKWYVYNFVPTYYDTNSVGNVYYAMYAVWVGKARELFFNHCLPDFDLKNTDYYILTRKFEHKYINETKEFDQIQVKIRVKNYNRKFATLEHKVMANGVVCGKGEQTLLFVSSKDYAPIDVPEEIITGMLQFL